MKTLKKTAVAAVLALVLAACLALVGCGSYSLEEGTYTGTYKCHYSYDYEIAGTGPNAGKVDKYHGDHFGAVVTFTVDAHGAIWDVTSVAPEADSDSGNAEYHTYRTAGMSNVFLNQFGGWTLGEIMAINVMVNDKGFPTEVDAGGKQMTIPAGQMPQCGIVILALQNAIENGTKAA